MIKVIKARPEHEKGILELLAKRGFSSPAKTLINGSDIAIVALSKDKVIGFVWCGLMASGSIGFIDYLAIDERYAERNVGGRMSEKLRRVIQAKQIDTVFGLIADDEFFSRSYANAQKLGMRLAPKACGLVLMEAS